MQKNLLAPSSARQIFTSFLAGFAAYANPLTGSAYTYGINRPSASFFDDMKNLQSDFAKSYTTVMDEVEEGRAQQLSLNLEPFAAKPNDHHDLHQ
jgi:hypothetical protein